MVFGLFGAKAKATPEIPVEEPLDSTTVAYVLCGTICAALVLRNFPMPKLPKGAPDSVVRYLPPAS